MNDPILAELRTVICRIAMVSHGSTMHFDKSTPSTDEDIGGKRPAGGKNFEDYEADEAVEFRQKSAEYFGHRLERCHTDRALEALLVEARQALWDWQHTPAVEGKDPEFGSMEWKRMIAASPLPAGQLGTDLGVSRQYVVRIRQAYAQ